MCGLWGWFGPSCVVPERLPETLARLLRHRGLDDRGCEQGLGWGLGFTHLSILDLSPAGHQPMRTPDGRYWLVFNGEIYNYVELRARRWGWLLWRLLVFDAWARQYVDTNSFLTRPHARHTRPS